MQSGTQPTLTTPRLVLRGAEASDLDELWRLWTHEDVRRYLWDDRVITRTEAEAVLADLLALAPDGLGLWLLIDRAAAADAQEVLGCAALVPVSTAAEFEPRLAGLVEPLIALWPTVWGNGYAHEALVALQTYAAEVLGLDRLAGVTDVPNDASDRMLRRAGFDLLGTADGPRSRLRTYIWDARAGAGIQQKLSL